MRYYCYIYKVILIFQKIYCEFFIFDSDNYFFKFLVMVVLFLYLFGRKIVFYLIYYYIMILMSILVDKVIVYKQESLSWIQNLGKC